MNRWQGIGRLTKDSELRFTEGKGTAKLNFTIAIDDGYGDNKTTNFINCVLWGKSAESLVNHLIKGKQIGVTGKLTIRQYDDKEGNKKYLTEIVVDMFNGITFCSGGSNTNNSNNNSNNSGNNDSTWEDATPVDDGDMPF